MGAESFAAVSSAHADEAQTETQHPVTRSSPTCFWRCTSTLGSTPSNRGVVGEGSEEGTAAASPAPANTSSHHAPGLRRMITVAGGATGRAPGTINCRGSPTRSSPRAQAAQRPPRPYAASSRHRGGGMSAGRHRGGGFSDRGGRFFSKTSRLRFVFNNSTKLPDAHTCGLRERKMVD